MGARGDYESCFNPQNTMKYRICTHDTPSCVIRSAPRPRPGSKSGGCTSMKHLSRPLFLPSKGIITANSTPAGRRFTRCSTRRPLYPLLQPYFRLIGPQNTSMYPKRPLRPPTCPLSWPRALKKRLYVPSGHVARAFGGANVGGSTSCSTSRR